MSRRHVRSGSIASAVILTAFITATTHNSAASPDSQLVDPVVAYIMQVDGVDLGTAEDRAVTETKAWPLSQQLEAYSPDRFGGVYLDPDTHLIDVLFVDPTSADQTVLSVKATLLNIVNKTHLMASRHSQSELSTAASAVATRLRAVIRNSPFTVTPDIVTQSIVVHISPSLVTTADAAAADIASNITFPTLKIVPSSDVPWTKSCDFTNDCDAPLRGGLYIDGPESFCTSGFMAHSYSDSKWYVLTAGHCTHFDAGPWQEYQPSNNQWHTIGASHSSTWNGPQHSDYGLITIDKPGSTGWNVKNWVLVYASPNQHGVLGTTLNESYPINNVSGNGIDQRVCFTGSASGTVCGKVIALGQETVTCIEDPDGTVLGCADIDHQAEMNAPSLGGDSGAPMYGMNNAYGILSAGNATNTYYNGAVQAQQDTNAYIILGS